MITVRLVQLATWLFRWRVVLPLVVLLFGIYLVVLHPWLIAWGASAEEQGDDAVG